MDPSDLLLLDKCLIFAYSRPARLSDPDVQVRQGLKYGGLIHDLAI